ncbi:helix-turn-helix transcriptional regulator [Pigmentiphaga aceris]|uniref:helix-turn-helix transcriptional regulator n=1 Tax=Pigmentiphaga aceris TaxID=1940612 RepID=UPI00165250DC|nr:response regulator transcription factor [Pigmentiphaga aceris]
MLDLTVHTYASGVLLFTGSSPSGFNLALEHRCAGCLLAISPASRIEAVLDWPGCEVHGGSSLLIDIRDVQTWRMHAGTFDCLVFPIDLLNRRLSHLLDRPLIKSVVFKPLDLTTVPGFPQILELVRVICRIYETESPLTHVRSITSGFEDMMLNFMLEVVPHSYSQLLKRSPAAISPRHVRRAVEYIQANARRAERIRLEDIAEAASVSVRSLQTGFASAKGMSPMEYLRTVRLEGARAELLNLSASRSVADVAAAWGYPHSGVFSRLYRAAFGELPSQTIKNKG